MMRKKWLLLVAALLLPGMIFMFLKFFGKNEFDVPVMFADGTVSVVKGCDVAAQQGAFKVPEQSTIPLNALTAIAFIGDLDGKPLTDYLFQLDRLKSEFENSAFKILVIDTSSRADEITATKLPSTEYQREKACNFLLPDEMTAVLVDGQRRIRGQYESTQKDTERLAVEVKILLKNY